MNTSPTLNNATASAVAASKPSAPTITPDWAKPRSGISAPKILLMGPPGTGKTWSIISLLLSGIEVFVLITEPNGLQNLLNAVRFYKAPLEKLHWHYVPPMAASWASLEDVVKQINSQTFQSIADNKAGIAKPASGLIMQVLKNIQNFHDERTGLMFGDATTWGYDRALVIDSLSGLNMLAIQNTVGLKPSMHQGEWGVAMNLEEMLINKLTSDMKAYFVLIAHVDRNINEASGMMLVTPAAIGAKLGPRIGRFFGEVILTVKKEDKFTWSTSELNSDVKQSLLPIKKDLPTGFKQIVEGFQDILKQV